MAFLAWRLAAPTSVLLLVATACGGIAVFDDLDEGSGGAGGGTVSSTSVVSSTTTVVTSSSSVSSSSSGGAPPIPPLVETDFGTVPVGTPLSVVTPPGALGVTGYARGTSINAQVTISTVRAPDQTQLVSNGSLPGTLNSYDNFDIATASVPETNDPQAMPFLNGEWTFVPGVVSGPPQVDVSIWYRQTLDGSFHGGAVDVNVFRVPSAASDNYVNQMVAGAIEGFAGLSLGTVRNFALSSNFSVVDENNFAAIYPETAGAPGKPVLNVMVVDFIDFGMFQPLGFAPGIPGNPLVQGSLQSAVVMMTTGDSVFDAATLRHETGHFAGLLHTSEQLMGFHDRLSDTPECLDVMQVNCPDLNNLMFPFAFPGSQLTVSSQQATVVQASALYRGAVEAGGGFAEPLDGSMSFAPDGSSGAAHLGSRAPFGGWRDLRLADAAQRLLQSHWCQHAETDPHELLLSHVDPATLLAVGLDEEAPPFVRGRALEHALRGGVTTTELDRVVDVAHDGTAARWVRVGAVRGLRVVAPERVADLVRDRDPVVAALAARR